MGGGGGGSARRVAIANALYIMQSKSDFAIY